METNNFSLFFPISDFAWALNTHTHISTQSHVFLYNTQNQHPPDITGIMREKGTKLKMLKSRWITHSNAHFNYPSIDES